MSKAAFEARELGRGNVAALGGKVEGFGKKVKEVTHLGEGQDYKSRSLKTEKTLTEKPEDLLKDLNEQETRATVQLAVQRAMAAEARGDTNLAKNIGKNLILAAVNNDKLSNDDIKNLSARLNINMNDFVRKMSPADALKNFNASALAKKEILINLSLGQAENILAKGSPLQKSKIVDFVRTDNSPKTIKIQQTIIAKNLSSKEDQRLEELREKETLSKKEDIERKEIEERVIDRLKL